MSITTQLLHSAKPLVFQCSGCRSILSDSTEFVCAMNTLDGAHFVCLRGATDVRVDSIPTTTAAPHSTVHFSLCCATCGAAVGRLYTQAPPALAPALNLFCLEHSCCLSYELGSADVRAPTTAAAPASQQQQSQQHCLGAAGGGGAAAAAAAAAGGGHDSLVLDLLQRVEQLEATLCTTQGMLVVHDERLQELEGRQGLTATVTATPLGGV